MQAILKFLAALFNKKPVSLNSDPVTTPVFRSDALTTATKFIAKWEGCRLTAYQDIVGVWTIGYGRTTNVRPGDTCTQEQADAWLQEEVAEFQRQVKGALQVNLTDNQLAACTSLAYNIGIGAFRGSTVARRINEMAMQSAADAFLMWNRAGGQVVQGLVNRRKAERDLFLS